MSELKSCPFCGGTDLHLESFSGWGADVVECYDCLAIFSQQEITCEEDLVRAWNRRVKDEPEIIRCEDCKHMIINKKHENKPMICCLTKMCGTTAPDWFCADGERREDE